LLAGFSCHDHQANLPSAILFGGFLHIGNEMNLPANDNFKPTKLLSFAELTTTRGITFSRRHLKRLEDEKKFPLRVVLGENRIGWAVTEIDEWLAAKLAERYAA
jgi:predicted DNA-binding transcriptional regulator AlpA